MLLKGSLATVDVPGARRVQIALDEKLSYSIREDGWYSEHFGDKEPARYLYAKIECRDSVEIVTKISVL